MSSRADGIRDAHRNHDGNCADLLRGSELRDLVCKSKVVATPWGPDRDKLWKAMTRLKISKTLAAAAKAYVEATCYDPLRFLSLHDSLPVDWLDKFEASQCPTRKKGEPVKVMDAVGTGVGNT